MSTLIFLILTIAYHYILYAKLTFVIADGDAATYVGYMKVPFAAALQGYQQGYPIAYRLLGYLTDDPGVMFPIQIVASLLASVLCFEVLQRSIGATCAWVFVLLIWLNPGHPPAVSNSLTELFGGVLLAICLAMYLADRFSVLWSLLVFVPLMFMHSRYVAVVVILLTVEFVLLCVGKSSQNGKRAFTALAAACLIFLGYLVIVKPEFGIQAGNTLQRYMISAHAEDFLPNTRADHLARLRSYVEERQSLEILDQSFDGGVWGKPFNAYMRKAFFLLWFEQPNGMLRGFINNIQMAYGTEMRPFYPEDPNRWIYEKPTYRRYYQLYCTYLVAFIFMSGFTALFFVRSKERIYAALFAIFVANFTLLFFSWSPLWWGDPIRYVYSIGICAAAILTACLSQVVRSKPKYG